MNFNLTPSASAQPATMSSREIAELTGKRHDHVMRDIREMLEALGEAAPKFGASYQDSTGRTLPMFLLPKDLTITLVSGYNVVMRHRIVTRWQELEAQVAAPALPNFHNPAEAARAWGGHGADRLNLDGYLRPGGRVLRPLAGRAVCYVV